MLHTLDVTYQLRKRGHPLTENPDFTEFIEMLSLSCPWSDFQGTKGQDKDKDKGQDIPVNRMPKTIFSDLKN